MRRMLGLLVFSILVLALLFSSVSADECTDSDGGKDYYVKGVCVGDSPNIGNSWSLTDHCHIVNKGTVYSCSGEDCQVVEHYCHTDKYDYGIEYYTCPNGCEDGACISEPVESDVLLVVDDDSPTSDVTLSINLAAWLDTKTIESTAKLNSEVKRKDTHEIITVFVFDKKFLIIIGKSSPASDDALANEIKQHLESEGQYVCPIIKSSALESDDLKSALCREPIQEPNPPEYSSSTENTGVFCGKKYKCTGSGWWKTSCSMSYDKDYRCRPGDTCINPEPSFPYCLSKLYFFSLGIDCQEKAYQKPGICKDTTAPQITNVQKNVGTTSATITWETNEPARSNIIELTNKNIDTTQTFILPTTYGTKHTASYSNLNLFTTYWFKIKAEDAAANSGDFSSGFQTLREEVEEEEEEEAYCNDLDAGKNYLVKSTCTDSVHPDMISTDLCVSDTHIQEHFCREETGQCAAISGRCDYFIGPDYVCREGACVHKDACVDTDPDVDYYKQGYIMYGTTVVWDMCGLRNIDGTFTEKYQCKDESNCILFEASCLPDNQPGGFASEDYKCPYGCKEGACIPGKELPNLIVTDLEFEPTVPKPNEEVTVIVHYKNTGSVDAVVPANSKFMGIYYRGQFKYAHSPSAEVIIKSGGSRTLYLYDTGITEPRAGKYRVSAKVNYNKVIEESDYSDNLYTEELEFSRYGEEGCLPDLEIASFTMAPSYVLANEPFEIKVKTINDGCATEYQQKYDSATAWLFIGEQVRLPVGDDFKVVKLLNVGSATTNTPVIVDVDGWTETVTGTETVPVTDGVTITVKNTFYDDDINKRSAILEIKLPNWKIASISGDNIFGYVHIEPIVSYPETNVYGDAITKDEPIPTEGGSWIKKKWMIPSTRIGPRVFNFTLDPDNIIKESDETNNELKQLIYGFTKEVDCYEDFTLGNGEEAIITGGRGGAIGASTASTPINIWMFKSYYDPSSYESKAMAVGESKDFLDGLYTVQYKSKSGDSATLRLTECPWGTSPETGRITRTMFTGGVVAINSMTGLSLWRFLFKQSN